MVMKLCRLVFVALLCAGSLATAPQRAFGDEPPAAVPGDADGEYLRARTLFHERKFAEAIAALDVFLAAHPRDARAIVLRGDAKADAGDNAGALKDYNVAIAIAPEFQYAYVTRCETRLQLDDTAGALADCDNAVRLDATDGLAFEDRADVNFQLENYDRALKDYNQAISLGRSTAYVFAARCDVERLVGQRELAKPDCEKSLQIDPKGRRGLWARARLAIVETRYIDGIADLNAYIAENPKSSDTAYYFRGFAYNRISKFALALEDLKVYVQRQPADPDGYRERGLASFGLGDKAGALADLGLAQRGYRKDGDTSEAERVAGMVKAIADGRTPAP